jgi:hypothetical protein
MITVWSSSREHTHTLTHIHTHANTLYIIGMRTLVHVQPTPKPYSNEEQSISELEVRREGHVNKYTDYRHTHTNTHTEGRSLSVYAFLLLIH